MSTLPKSAGIAAPDRELLITRVFDAPRDRVFKAWADPQLLLQWYAPQGCTLKIARWDFRVGGSYLTCIANPAFKDCWCAGDFKEIVVPERIVFSMKVVDKDGHLVQPAQLGMDPDWPAEALLTVTFADLGGKTEITLHQTVSEALAKRTGAHPSWLQMLDRLGDLLRAGDDSK